MKRDNNIIKITNLETGEYKYFTSDTYVLLYIGCSQGALPQIKGGSSLKYKNWKYEIVDGSDILYKNINNI